MSRSAIARRLPLGRLGEAGDIAGAGGFSCRRGNARPGAGS